MKWKLLVIAALSASLAMNCKKNTEDTSEEGSSTYDVSEQALSEASAQATASEGGSSAISSNISQTQIDILEEETQFAKNSLGSNSADQVTQLASSCKYSARTCSGVTGTIVWDSCTISGSAGTVSMTGGWTETWTNVGDCTNGYLSGIGENVTRSTDASTINFAAGATITTDTKGGTAYDGTVFASGGIVINRNNALTRAVSMYPSNSAIHKVYKGRRGSTLFDYFTVPSLTITGSKGNSASNGLTGSRSITGSVKIYHNIANYTATNTFSTVAWGSSACCYPTSGMITTSYSGSGAPSGPVTLTFSSTCGTANFSTPDNLNGVDITLTNCQ